jgi:type I restriction enzyme M protein
LAVCPRVCPTGHAPRSSTPQTNGNGIAALTAQLWQAAVNLRGSIEPADYKRYVLPIIFLRFLSLRYERRRAELERLIADPASEYHTTDPRVAADILAALTAQLRAGAFIVPENARWSQIRTQAQADDIKVRLDDILDELERTYPDKLRGLLPRIYAGSNLDRENVTALINLFSKDIFEQDHDGADLIGRVYEYFIGEFASSEGKRGGEYFTPVSIDRGTLQRGDGAARSAPDAGGRRLRGLHRAAFRPVVRQYADPMRSLVPVEEPRRDTRLP